MRFLRLLMRQWQGRASSPALRPVLIACVTTLAVTTVLLGLTHAAGWGKNRALSSDTTSIAEQTSEQLLRSLVSRRGTLTFLRDTLNRQTDLSPSQLRALGASATEHTRHLLGVGMIRSGAAKPSWWFGPEQLTDDELKQLTTGLNRRLQQKGIWQVPSTFAVELDNDRWLLAMLEPIDPKAFQESAVLGVFDAKPLLADVLSSGLARQHPTRVVDDEDRVLYQSAEWSDPPADDPLPIVATAPVKIDAIRWLVHVQPGRTRLIQALSIANAVVIALSLLAGGGIIAIAWMLVARTWLLERAVIRRTAALRRTLTRLRQLATTDELTGLHNRRYFFTRWASEYDRAKRYERPLACLMIDVNGFKQVNDRLGHLAGDRLLQRVAAELKLQFRQSDTLARIGGDEFIVALPETDLISAESVAAKLRQIRITPVNDATGLPPVRLSVGAAWNSQPSVSSQDILQAADTALYEDKRRNRAARETASAGTPSAVPS